MLCKNVIDAVNRFKSGIKNYPKVDFLNNDGGVNEEAIKIALKMAFPDITPRTMTRENWNDLVAFDKLPEELYNYKEKDQSEAYGVIIKNWFCLSEENIKDKEFDKIHCNACDTVVEFLKCNGYTEESATYGKAQKVVNMMFKHLFCLAMKDDGTVEKEKHFEFCHMALDSFTLEWLKRTKDSKKSNIVKGKVDSWSAIQKSSTETYTKKSKDKELTFYSYKTLVNMIRDIIPQKDYPCLTPFQAEFIIWPEIQLHLAAEALFGQEIGKEETVKVLKEKIGKEEAEEINFTEATKIFRRLDIKQKIEIVQDKLKVIGDYYNKLQAESNKSVKE